MLYVFQTFALWFLAALVLGLIVGWFTWSNEPRGHWFSGWFGVATAIAVIGLVVAFATLLPGRAGLWLETALFCIADYTIGCLIGSMMRSLAMHEPLSPKLATAGAAAIPAKLSPAPAARAAPPVPARAPAPPPPAAKPAAPMPVAAKPPPAPSLPDEDKHEGQRPAGLAHARDGVIDNLKLIRGIGHQNEGRLHGLGIWHFDQIGAWTRDNCLWVGSYLAFTGRIEREKWVAQAKQLAAGKTTKFADRVNAGRVKTSIDDGSFGLRNIEKATPKTAKPKKK